MECEICGQEGAPYLVLVEGAKLRVCRECSLSGKIIYAPPEPARQAEQTAFAKEEVEIVDGYGKLIMEARKKLGIPLEVLAEKINEKASFLERIEHEKTLPNEKLCRKLEKELGITLLVSSTEAASAGGQVRQKELTLGDIIEIEHKKKK
ncbi:MAG: multiprotein bridging factor aMBF1 [Candidatus Micrarchaeota archaeon]|nr:multiprotein bridging factor aMBF1 [Candidatus Micrarchaeota archaeon]